jgi:hypothetical protein
MLLTTVKKVQSSGVVLCVGGWSGGAALTSLDLFGSPMFVLYPFTNIFEIRKGKG